METKYIAYEYKNVKVPNELESLWVDSLANYGWELDGNKPATVKRAPGPLWVLIAPLSLLPGTPFAKMLKDHDSETDTQLTFKRDKNIPNKERLDRLQAQFEHCAKGLVSLENSKKSSASTVGYLVGIIGTVFMGLAMFAYLASMMALCVVLAVPGFACWILSYVAFRGMKNSCEKKVAPTIEDQYETIHGLCKSANDLMHMRAAF